MKTKMQSGPTPPALMWRNAGWASTTATLLPPASTPPPPMSATVREDTQEMAHCTATRRKSLLLKVHPSVPSSFSCAPNKHFHPSHRCYNECREGQCSGSPRFECECSLGWTSDPATLVLSGVECDVDCGCHFHSTCITAPGICDECQGEA